MSGELCFTANTAGSTVELCIVGSPSIANTAYSTDTITWTTFTPSTTAGTNVITLANVGDKVYFRNDITANLSTSKYMQFKMSGSISASGNINSMYDADNFGSLNDLAYSHCFYNLLRSCSVLTTPPVLPATGLTEYCYFSLFRDCTSLTAAPILPADSLCTYCYTAMFQGCTSLTTAPELPATNLAPNCYQQLFRSCTSLITPPSVLPATTLSVNCYTYLFRGCASLNKVPDICATVLATRCYEGMFRDCASLTITPTLPITTLADYCYYAMFYLCPSLLSVPELPAITLTEDCYGHMFNGCTSLTTAPALPATTLAIRCYESMFCDCTSLTSLPELPATALTSQCYYQMFKNCTSIKLSTTKDSTYRTPYRIPWINDGTTDTNALLNMFTNTGGSFTGTPEINTIYYGDWDPEPILITSNRTVDGVTKPYLVCSGTNILKQN